MESVANDTLHGVDLVIDANGRASLVPNNEAGPPSPEQQAFATTLQTAIGRPEAISINVVSGHSNVRFGQYLSETIDIGDIATAGPGVAVSGSTLLAHEVIGQTAKQVFGLPNRLMGYELAHGFGVGAQEFASGFTLKSQNDLTFKGTGMIVSQHQRGTRTVTTTFYWLNGNLVKISRR